MCSKAFNLEFFPMRDDAPVWIEGDREDDQNDSWKAKDFSSSCTAVRTLAAKGGKRLAFCLGTKND
jgi:hypothetical protein